MWPEQDIHVWNEQLGAVFSRKESKFNKTPEQVNEAVGITCCFEGAFHPCMNHSSPRRVLSHPKDKRLHRGSFVAIYVQLLEEMRSKSSVLPCKQRWWADGGVNSPALSHLWDSPISGRFALALKGSLCWVTDSCRIYCFFCGAPLAEIKAVSTQSSPSTSDPQATVQRKHPLSLFWFSQTCRTILRIPVSSLIIYFVYLVL